MADTYSPNDGMKSAARRALAWKKDGRRGGTIIGVTRAHQIVSGENLSASTVKRMYSFFSRHEVDKKATGFSSGEEGYPSPGRVAWDLWGGDAGFSWSRRLVAGMEKADELSIDPNKKNPQQGTYRPAPQMRLKDNGEQMDGEDVGESPDAWAGLNERQDDQAEAYCMIVEEYGQFDQSSGPDGAHYAPGDKNPFKSDGLICENCIFFEGNACHLVSGEIDPQGICKLWIIASGDGEQETESENQDMEMSKVSVIKSEDYVWQGMFSPRVK